MRANYAGLAAFAGLAALVTGDGLPPDAIPIQCATICGPMVELTALCDVHSSVRRKRSADEEVRPREWVPKLAVEPKVGGRAVPPYVGQTPHRPVTDDEELAKRNFTVIRPAPTSFSPELLSEGLLDLKPTTTRHHINPIIIDRISRHQTRSSSSSNRASLTAPPSVIVTPDPDDVDPPISTPPVQPPAVPPPSSIPPPSVLPFPSQPDPLLPPPSELPASPPAQSKNPATTTVTLGDMSNTLSSPPMEATGGKEQKGTDNANTHPVGSNMPEEQCVCLNTSFDVAQVAALCASCIQSATGDPNNNGQIIVDTCNFAPQVYTQAKDKIVNNIRVKAVRPGNAWDQGSSVDNSGSAASPARRFAISLAAATAGFLLGSAVLL